MFNSCSKKRKKAQKNSTSRKNKRAMARSKSHPDIYTVLEMCRELDGDVGGGGRDVDQMMNHGRQNPSQPQANKASSRRETHPPVHRQNSPTGV